MKMGDRLQKIIVCSIYVFSLVGPTILESVMISIASAAKDSRRISDIITVNSTVLVGLSFLAGWMLVYCVKYAKEADYIENRTIYCPSPADAPGQFLKNVWSTYILSIWCVCNIISIWVHNDILPLGAKVIGYMPIVGYLAGICFAIAILSESHNELTGQPETTV